MDTKDSEGLSFEDAFERLEVAITALQDGKIPLDRALQHYQEGMQLAQYCNTLLQHAELYVQQLSAEADGTLSIQALDV